MAVLSDDDVPDLATATGLRAPEDGSDLARFASSLDDDETTLRATVDPALRAQLGLGGYSSVPKVVPPPRRSREPDSPVRITSKKMTAVGIGAPPISRSPASVPAHASRPDPIPRINTQSEIADDLFGGTGTSTATAPSFVTSSGAILSALALPAIVQIREMEEEEDALDETESRTLVGEAAPARTTDAADLDRSQAYEPDDSVTTHAPSPGPLFGEGHSPVFPPPLPAAGRGRDAGKRPPARQDLFTDEESSTSRGPARAVLPDFEDPSATGQAPLSRPGANVRSALDMPPSFDEPDPKKRVPKRAPRSLAPNLASTLQSEGSSGARKDSYAADGEVDSITANAPAPPVGDLLRLLPPTIDPIEDDDLPGDRTKVMASAPIRPSSGSSRAARPVGMGSTSLSSGQALAIADLRADFQKPSSDSGLRVAHADPQSGHHASAGVFLGQGAAFDHGSGGGLASGGSSEPRVPIASPFAVAELPSSASSRRLPFSSTISKKPHYVVLVVLVAAVCVAVPIALFLWLHQGGASAAAASKPAATSKEAAPSASVVASAKEAASAGTSADAPASAALSGVPAASGAAAASGKDAPAGKDGPARVPAAVTPDPVGLADEGPRGRAKPQASATTAPTATARPTQRTGGGFSNPTPRDPWSSKRR